MLRSSNRKKENAALGFLHRQLYNMTTQFVLKYKGTVQDAEDVLQEALIAFFKFVRTHKNPQSLNAEAYVFTICKNKWYRKLKSTPQNLDLSEQFEKLPAEDINIKSTLNDEKAYLMRILEGRLPKGCYQMLVYFYYEGRKMKEIARLLSLGSEQVAKNKKSKCMKELKRLMLEEPEFRKAFQ